MTGGACLRPGVLILGPGRGETRWTVVEVDAEVFDRLHVSADEQRCSDTFAGQAAALAAVFDLLTLMSEGRCPAMDEHTEETMREFVRALREKGYDQQAAVTILRDIVDRVSIHPPKGQDGAARLSSCELREGSSCSHSAGTAASA